MDNDIVSRVASLLPHERSALLAALQRDADVQLSKAGSDSAFAEHYLFNYRIVVRLLEVLAPLDYRREMDGPRIGTER